MCAFRAMNPTSAAPTSKESAEMETAMDQNGSAIPTASRACPKNAKPKTPPILIQDVSCTL